MDNPSEGPFVTDLMEEEEEEEEEEESEYLDETRDSSEDDEKVDWGFGEDEEIFNLKNLRFKPFTTAITELERYSDAVEVTGTLYTHQFIKHLKENIFKTKYYDKPYKEYYVQSQFWKSMEDIDLTDIDTNYDLMYHLVKDTEVLANLKTISLRKCNIDEELLKILCPKLEDVNFLSLLDLSHNPIGDEGFKVITKYLPDWVFLKHLNLFDTQITHTGLEGLAKVYSKQKIYLTTLNLGRNLLNNHKTINKFFIAFTKKSIPLEDLRLPHTCLQGEEIVNHFQLLTGVKSLKYLDLSFNHFSTIEEMVVLAGMFINSSLETLILNFNPLNDEVVLALLDKIFLGQELSCNKTLYIENMTIPEHYFKNKWTLFNRPDIRIIFGGVRKFKLPKLDSVRYKFIKRINFVQHKGKKPKRDDTVKIIQTELTGARLRRVKVADFKDALMQLKRMDPKLAEDVALEFAGGGTRANVQDFIDIYNELYPQKVVRVSKRGTKKEEDEKKPTEQPNKK